jgi:hypothetical protein
VKILLSSPDRLVLADSGASLRAVGGVFATVGAGFLFAAWVNWPHAIGPTIFGPIAIVIGLAFILLPSRVTASFDRPSHTLVITRHTLRSTTRDEVDLSKVSDVVAEPASSLGAQGSSQQTYRVTVVLRDGYRLPLTSWYTSGTSHAGAAAAARAFLGITESPTPPTTGVTPPDAAATIKQVAGEIAETIQARRTKGRRFTAVVFALFGLTFFAVGGWLNYVQFSKLSHYRPTPAVVLFSSITSHRGSKGGTTWSPNITYCYTVDDREYVSANVTVMKESRSGSWAQKITSRYRPGDSTTAWYNPQDASDAFLLHEFSILPMIFMLIPLIFVAAASFVFTRALRQAHPVTASPPPRQSNV